MPSAIIPKPTYFSEDRRVEFSQSLAYMCAFFFLHLVHYFWLHFTHSEVGFWNIVKIQEIRPVLDKFNFSNNEIPKKFEQSNLRYFTSIYSSSLFWSLNFSKEICSTSSLMLLCFGISEGLVWIFLRVVKLKKAFHHFLKNLFWRIWWFRGTSWAFQNPV